MPAPAERERSSRGGGRQPGRRTAMVVERREAQRARSRRFAQADLLWRAPRPKRGRVATSVRVAWPTTPAPPGAPFARGFSCAWLFVTLALAKLGRKQTRRENRRACPAPCRGETVWNCRQTPS